MNLKQLIREEISTGKDPDPHKVGQRVAMKITSRKDRDAVLTQLLGELARIEMTRLRGEDTKHRSSVRTPGPSRLSVYRQSVYVDGVWKFLTDCTRVDCLWLADDYTRQAQQMSAQAGVWKKRAHELQRYKCGTIDELLKLRKRKQKAA